MKIFESILTPEIVNSQIPGLLKSKFKTELIKVADLKEADKNTICFFENPIYYNDLINSDAGLIFVPTEFKDDEKVSANLIFCKTPYILFMMLVKNWLEKDSTSKISEIHKTATIATSATIGENVAIGANAVISEDVTIGNNTIIHSNCVIMKNVTIGQNCKFFPNITIYENCSIGNNVILHAGVVIGADGFGYIFNQGIQNKIPHIGEVIIENDVEIGANSCVDRATLSKTIIGNGTKIDNLVQIGHNCQVGENSIICAQTGLAGSTIIKNRVYLAGQVGVGGHLTINDDVLVGAQSGVTKSIKEKTKIFGTPAMEAGRAKRIIVSQRQLPQLLKDFRELKKNLEKESQ